MIFPTFHLDIPWYMYFLDFAKDVCDWEGKGPCAIVPLTWKMARKSLCRMIRNGPLKISKSLKKAENGPFGKKPLPNHCHCVVLTPCFSLVPYIQNTSNFIQKKTGLQRNLIHNNTSDWEGKGPCTIVPLFWKMAHQSLCRMIRNGPLKIPKSLKKAENGPLAKISYQSLSKY